MKKMLICFVLVLATTIAFAESVNPVNAKDGVALRGYDPVAYFSSGKAVKGTKEFTHSWNGVQWHFVNEANKNLFVASPEKFTPQFGGYCAYAASRDYIYDADPNFWKIVDGRLYLNYNGDAKKEWEKDITGNIEKGNKNWPGLLKRKE